MHTRPGAVDHHHLRVLARPAVGQSEELVVVQLERGDGHTGGDGGGVVVGWTHLSHLIQHVLYAKCSEEKRRWLWDESERESEIGAK